MLVKAAKFFHATPIIGVDVYEKDITSLGADVFINAKDITEPRSEEYLKNVSVDVIINSAGNPKSITDTLPLLGPNGRYILLGGPAPGTSFEVKNADHLFGGEGKTIKATQGGGFNPTKEIPRYVKLHKAGLLDINGLITHRTKLGDINHALELMRTGKVNRIIVDL